MSKQLDSELVAKAVKALFQFEEKKHVEKGSKSLVGYYAKPVIAQIQLKQNIKKAIVRPVRVKIPNSMFAPDEEDHTICLFCRSEDREAIESYLKANPIEGLTKVVSINQVRKLYVAYKDRKKLLNEHSHFVCDSRVMTQLYNLLGKVFAERNNFPVPIDYTGPSKIQGEVVKVVSSTYMHLKGKNIAIRFGLTFMSPKDVTVNVIEGLEFAVAKFSNQWKDVHSIILKTSDSPALPIYSRQTSETMEYVKKIAASPANSKAAEPVVETKKATGKGKKAAAATALPAPAPAVEESKPAEKGKKTGAKKNAQKEENEEEEEAPKPKKRGARPAAAPVEVEKVVPVKKARKTK
jgi:ribosome biogenesis protein UTP30